MANVTLRKKVITNNKFSLFLDYFPPIINPKTGKPSRREFLKLQIYAKPKDDFEKIHNKTTLELADLVRAKRLTQIRDREFGFKENVNLDVDFIKFYQNIVDDYENKGSKSNYFSWKSSLEYFKVFAGNELQTKLLSTNHIKNFRAFLLDTKNLRTKKGKLSINTASCYYKNFIAVLKKANKENLITNSLLSDAVFIKEEETYREYLSEEELKTLWKTEIKLEIVKDMAIFSALTGLRFIDIKKLLWENVHSDKHQGDYIKLKEKKTGNLFNHPLTKNAFSILNKQKNKEGYVFGDIKYSSIIKPLSEWIENSGIYKKITFHNFRHTFATLQLANGTDIYTVSRLLGHKNVSTTQVYAKVMDKSKLEAVNRINLNLDGLS